MRFSPLLLLFAALTSCHSTSTPPTTAEPASPALLLFTGSSSIRMWYNLQQAFPGYKTENTGFGGSQFSDLLEERDEAIYRFLPDVLFIYEGDNDIALGKSVNEILADADSLIDDIRDRLPTTRIVLISAKPSPSRWHFKDSYTLLNDALLRMCRDNDKLFFADVWNPMLRENGRVRGDIFIGDSLHMNEEGYRIWQGILQKVLQEQCGVLPVNAASASGKMRP